MYIRSFKIIARDYRFFGGFCILWVLIVVIQDAGIFKSINAGSSFVFQTFLSLGTMQIVLLDQSPFDRNAYNKDLYKISGFVGRSILLQLLILALTLILPIVFGAASPGNSNSNGMFLVMLFGAVLALGFVNSILGLSLPAKVLSTNETLLDAFEQGIRVFPKHFLHQLLVAFGGATGPIVLMTVLTRFAPGSDLTIVNGQPNIIGIITAILMAASGIVFSVISSVILCEFYRRTHPVQVVEPIGVDRTLEPTTE